MADVTISSLPTGTPAGNNTIPYSTGSVTLGTPVSAILQNAGNIGIGTVSPSYLLDLRQNYNGALVNIEGSSDNIAIRLKNNQAGGREYRIISTAQGSGYGAGALALEDQASGSARVVINNAGNVGIGTTTPQAKLDVNGSMFNNNLPMYGVRAWVKFSGVNDVNGTPSAALTDRQIFASGNVTRVNRWALGNYDIYLNTPFANTSYSVVANIIHAVGFTTAVHIDAYGQTGGVVRTWCSYQPNTISYDPNIVDVWVIG